MEGHERIRLFVALRLPDETVERFSAWQIAELDRASDARIVPPGNLHVTFAFLGSRPTGDIEPILALLRKLASSSERPLLAAGAYRETRSVGMVRLDDEGEHAARLAGRVGEGLEGLGVYERERAWLPHVTVLRFRRPPRLKPAPPDLGRFSPSEVALYHSVLRPTGAQYEVVESIPLGG